MFITRIALKDGVDKTAYPFNIPALRDFDELAIKTPVAFFVGENGSGKSTLLEGIAVAVGLNAEGGSNNFMFRTKDTHSRLYEELLVGRVHVPKTKYFLRAESFYNLASEVDRMAEDRDPYARNYSAFAGSTPNFVVKPQRD